MAGTSSWINAGTRRAVSRLLSRRNYVIRMVLWRGAVDDVGISIGFFVQYPSQ